MSLNSFLKALREKATIRQIKTHSVEKHGNLGRCILEIEVEEIPINQELDFILFASQKIGELVGVIPKYNGRHIKKGIVTLKYAVTGEIGKLLKKESGNNANTN